MRLTSFNDYGFRMLMRVASDPNRVFSTAELAEEFGLSRNHLAKIMQRLAQGGIITTRRGSGGGGGASLARPPEEIRQGALIRLMEEDQPLVGCFASGGGNRTLDGRCRLKACLQSAEAVFLAEMDRSTLADITLAAGPAIRVAQGME